MERRAPVRPVGDGAILRIYGVFVRGQLEVYRSLSVVDGKFGGPKKEKKRGVAVFSIADEAADKAAFYVPFLTNELHVVYSTA